MQGRAGKQAWRRRKGIRVTDVSDFEPTRINLRMLETMPLESYAGIIDYVERGEYFNKWRRQTEERLEVFFTDGQSVVLNDGMERTIIDTYGTNTGAWQGRQISVSIRRTEHLNKNSGEIRTTAIRVLTCDSPGLSSAGDGANIRVEHAPVDADD